MHRLIGVLSQEAPVHLVGLTCTSLNLGLIRPTWALFDISLSICCATMRERGSYWMRITP